MTSGPSQQPQDQSGLSQPQPQQAPPSCSQPNQPQQSSSQSHPSLPESSTDTDTADFVSTRRKTRGPTRCLSLWGRQEGERISVPTNKLGQPIGRLAPKLSNFLGTIARNGHVAPLTYVDWRGMPDASKEKMWQLVLSKVDISPSGRTWVLQSLGKKWKDWKSQLKAKHYYPHQTDEERLADRDERVLPDQWAILIAFWNSEEGQERTATNRANRAQQKLRHTLGTKSLARLCEEERAKRPNGEEPTWEELFILTHTRKDGQPVDEASAAAISQLCKQTAQQSKTTQGSTPLDDSQVMGEYMTMHTFEDPSPSNIRGRKPSRAEALRMATEAKRLA
ncbi:hypothetical protein L1049_015030 [Liquidambar formosana]|uniref:Uncharacterized protein n=1 Tax=Liquidambar formosana TaxID=63359 RepID=A0AAP0X670_LIQFO